MCWVEARRLSWCVLGVEFIPGQHNFQYEELKENIPGKSGDDSGAGVGDVQ